MRRFSEKQGLISPRQVIQRKTIDERLRNRLWSACHESYWQKFHFSTNDDKFAKFVFLKLWDIFFGMPVDSISASTASNIAFVKKQVVKLDWNVFYDFVQFMADFANVKGEDLLHTYCRRAGGGFIARCNEVLSQERSAYRFVASELCEITDEREIQEIEIALNLPGKFNGSRQHLATALTHYANRDAPDYRNSIKESVSAIESAFTAINGERSINLPTALKLAEKRGFKLHPALNNGISNIYGWSSNEAGIRHALIDGDSNVDEADAKFMLVLCSTFLNYLAVKQA